MKGGGGEKKVIMVMGKAGKSGVLSLHGYNTVVIYLFIFIFKFDWGGEWGGCELAITLISIAMVIFGEYSMWICPTKPLCVCVCVCVRVCVCACLHVCVHVCMCVCV